MRVVGRRIAEAFREDRRLMVNNTYTGHGQVVLHGARIARRTASGDILVTLAGYASQTTFSRVNDLCEYFGGGRPFRMIRGQTYYEDQPVKDLRKEFPVGVGRVGELGRLTLDLAA